MKKFLYWFLGDRLGRVAVGSINWFLGAPIEKGNAQTVAIGQEALADMAENVENMRNAVAEQKAALEQALGFLQQMENDEKQLDNQSRSLVLAGDDDGAMTILTELGVITDSLPQIQNQAEQAKKNYEASLANLQDLEREYKKYEVQQKISSRSQKVSAALEQANRYSGLGANSAKTTLDATAEAVQSKAFVQNAKLELSSSANATTRKVAQITAADKLAALKASMNQPLAIEGKETVTDSTEQ